MNGSFYTDLLELVLPELALVMTALLVLLLDVRWFHALSRDLRMRRAALGSVVGLTLALAVVNLNLAAGDAPGATFVLEPATQFLKSVLLILSLATALFAATGRFTRHVGEFFALLLFATVGLLLLVATENLLMLFVALELVSLSLYVMTAFHDENPNATEAALKYFLFGGLAAAFTLFGISLLFGLTGSIQLSTISAKLAGAGPDPLLWVALVLVVAGLGFKVAVVPFHLWAPDVYQGAPTPAAALIASGSKIAGFLLLVRVLQSGFGTATQGSAGWGAWTTGWIPLVAGIATLSMIVGNLMAIGQTDLRRLLAYSAVAQAGYALVGMLGPAAEARPAVLYFAVTYAVTALGAFGVVSALESAGNGVELPQLAGLGRRSPLLAACLTVFVLSLAGIPPLAGFFGKLFVFVRAVSPAENLGRLWLVVVAVAMSAVSLYYYLQVLKHALVVASPADAPPLKIAPLTALALVILALLTVLLGCFPEVLLERLR